MNIYTQRVEQIRNIMKQEGLGMYYIPMDDCHGSEYVADHFRCIEFVSGFTGSAGKLIITAHGAWLYADGRYYIQAEKQLAGSGIELMKWGAPKVPEPEEFIGTLMSEILQKDSGLSFGLDGNNISKKQFDKFIESIARKCRMDENDIKVRLDLDLPGQIWTERPDQIMTQIEHFPLQYSGEETASKLSRIRAEIEKSIHGSYLLLISALDDIAWIFNIRARDLPETPAAYAFAAISETEAKLFVRKSSLKDGVEAELNTQGVTVEEYDTECLKMSAPGRIILMDPEQISEMVYDFYEQNGCTIKDMKNPSTAMKGVKNETELKCACDALLRDSARVTYFMYKLKKRSAAAGSGKLIKMENGSTMTEITADEELTAMRAEDPLFMERSFATIAAYKENGAMMHYQAKPDNYRELRAEGMLLVDSGAQYCDGTTDITRTFVLGDLSAEEKKAFTLTAVSMLRLADTVFIEGCTGENLDIMAREPMWKEGWDYKCGTGHGVGHVLNVHEGPHRLKWSLASGTPTAKLISGMIVTDEPGVYREGKFGIRTENELFVKKINETEDGTFFGFGHMTFIPIDLDGIDLEYLSAKDTELLNNYHKMVYEKISPLLPDEAQAWLKEYTREI